MNRLLIGFCVVLGLAVVLALAFLLQPNPVASKPLTLPDGSVVEIIGVTYGTNHVLGPPLARMAARLPSFMQDVLSKVFGNRAVIANSTTTADPALVVWLERSTNNVVSPGGSFDVVLSDAAGFVSGEVASMYGFWSTVERLSFHVVPRRDRTVRLNFYHRAPTGKTTPCGTMPFANPLYGTYPQWRAESLPATKRAGDVEVKLERLSTGHGHNISSGTIPGGRQRIDFGSNREDGRNNSVCLIRLRSLTDSSQVWRIAGEEVSDATGNHVHSGSLGWGSYEEGYFTFAPGLWPSEAAWKLKCELKRAEGFAPGETFVFQNVPLGTLNASNPVGWTTNFKGVMVTMDYIMRRPPNTNSSWSSSQISQVHFTVGGLTNGLHLDLVGARTDNGTNMPSGSWGSSNNHRTYDYRYVPLNAQTVDFEFAVQNSRWVEFTIKPEVGKGRIEYKPVRRR